jgi:hypothetical protein
MCVMKRGVNKVSKLFYCYIQVLMGIVLTRHIRISFLSLSLYTFILQATF